MYSCSANEFKMINLHLLSKVSGFDADFRNEILNMIAARYTRVGQQTRGMMQQGRFMACYLFLEQYVADIQPYTDDAFTARLNGLLRAFKVTPEPSEKVAIAEQFLGLIQTGLNTTRAAISGSDLFTKSA